MDSTVMTGVVGEDPIEAGNLGLRNLDLAAGMLVEAATVKGGDYVRLAELYAALTAQRQQELFAVTKLVGGVIETRSQAKRGPAPFAPVLPQRQRAAVKFLIDRGFALPTALVDPNILKRITPGGGADALQGSNRELLSRLLDPSVFQRMADSQAALPRAQRYVGADLLRELNRGLFSELDRATPVIGLYRRDLQRIYVRLLVRRVSGEETGPRALAALESAFNFYGNSLRDTSSAQQERSIPVTESTKDPRRDQNVPSEFRAAMRGGIEDLALKLKAARKRVTDDETSLHLSDILVELQRSRP